MGWPRAMGARPLQRVATCPAGAIGGWVRGIPTGRGRGGGRSMQPLWLDAPLTPKKGSTDGPPEIPLTPRAPEVTRTPKEKKKRKWDVWNQRVEGVRKSHHLPGIR